MHEIGLKNSDVITDRTVCYELGLKNTGAFVAPSTSTHVSKMNAVCDFVYKFALWKGRLARNGEGGSDQGDRPEVKWLFSGGSL